MTKKERDAAYYASHREERRIVMLAYYAAHREAALIYARNYRVAHREEIRITKAAHYIIHREEILAAHVANNAAHPEKAHVRVREWRTAHPIAARTKRARHRALKLSAPGVPYTATEFRALCDESSWQCSYCPTILDVITIQADHVIPLSRGGSNGIENIAVSCGPCNSSKNNTPLDVWLKRRRKVA